MRLLIVVSFLFYITAQSQGTELPSFIHVCHRDDPKLEECIMASVEEIRPYLAKGVPEYNIPSLEPLIMYDLISEEIVGMKITANNVSAYGCSEYFVRHIYVDLDNYNFTIYIDIPKLRLETNYHVDGKLLLLPVKGNGDLEANVTDCITRTELLGECYEKDGKKYIRFTSIKMDIKVGGGNVRMENLFNNDKVLLGIINDIINKNLDTFLKELLPHIANGLSSTFLDIGNKIVQSFTYQQLFPH